MATTKNSNRSPWVHQLDADRPIRRLEADLVSDLAIVGGGIAGVSSAFFALKRTDMDVALIERFRLAHGATGHNAGLVVADFERPLDDLERQFGEAMTFEAVRAVEGAWLLLDEMYEDSRLSIPFSRFVVATGLSSVAQVRAFLAKQDVRRRSGIRFEALRLVRGRVPQDVTTSFDKDLYCWVDAADIAVDLETDDAKYVAAAYERGGAINSALFCQEVVRYLLSAYPSRFSLFEETKASKVILHSDDRALLDCGEAVVDAGRVLLCTNGFEDFSILAPDGLRLDKQFHKNVRGVVSYMSGYLVPTGNEPAGLVYLQGEGMSIEDYYYYMTRRPYEYDRGLGPRHDLLSVGGPQVLIEDHTAYSFQDGYPEERSAEIQGFLDTTFRDRSPKESERTFAWHGLMGYTRDMVRVVGAEPSHPALMYNLGCNGIGILPSIFGGNRIAAILAGDDVLPCLFDPRE